MHDSAPAPKAPKSRFYTEEFKQWVTPRVLELKSTGEVIAFANELGVGSSGLIALARRVQPDFLTAAARRKKPKKSKTTKEAEEDTVYKQALEELERLGAELKKANEVIATQASDIMALEDRLASFEEQDSNTGAEDINDIDLISIFWLGANTNTQQLNAAEAVARARDTVNAVRNRGEQA